jgi:hypothetical protein
MAGQRIVEADFTYIVIVDSSRNLKKTKKSVFL